MGSSFIAMDTGMHGIHKTIDLSQNIECFAGIFLFQKRSGTGLTKEKSAEALFHFSLGA